MVLSAGTMDQMETMVVICCILLLSIRDTTESECSDAAESDSIPYIRMCEDGSVASDKVILDTHEAEATGETTCLCSVNLTLFALVNIQHTGNGLNPNTSGCDSEVVAITKLGTLEKYKCNKSPEVALYVLPMTLTWNGVPGGDSKYCLNITEGFDQPNATFTITCFKPVMTTTTSSTRTKTSTAAETTTTSEMTTPAMTNASNTDQGTASVSPTTFSIPDDSSTQRPADSLPLIIVIPAAAGGFVLILIIVIITVVCCSNKVYDSSKPPAMIQNHRQHTQTKSESKANTKSPQNPWRHQNERKHGKSSKGRDSYIDDTIDPYGTSGPMNNATADDEEGYGMKKNSLYITSGPISSNGNYSTVQLPQSKSPEVEYAQVRKSMPKQNEESEQNKIELSNLNGTGNDLYAVVNKSIKNKNADKSTKTSHTTDEGLIYVEVETTGLDQPRPKPNTSDNSKDMDHVAYAQVAVT